MNTHLANGEGLKAGFIISRATHTNIHTHTQRLNKLTKTNNVSKIWDQTLPPKKGRNGEFTDSLYTYDLAGGVFVSGEHSPF